jgi:hypothetical protein
MTPVIQAVPILELLPNLDITPAQTKGPEVGATIEP